MKVIRSRAPLRVEFGGGGTDVSPYPEKYGGVILDATINRYVYATVKAAKKVVVRSIDYDQEVSYLLNEKFSFGTPLDLACGVVEYFRRKGYLKGGVEIILHSDAPPGSGLGASSSLVVALVGALAEYCDLKLDRYELAEKAFHIERVELKHSGGRQDQYAAAFGGFNFMQFGKNQSSVHPLPLSANILRELHYQLVFAYIGNTRSSLDIVKAQTKKFKSGNKQTVAAMNKLKDLCFKMRDALIVNDLDTFASLIEESWQTKQKMTEGISNDRINSIYTKAIKVGAKAGAVSGAGGGGFMFFICDPMKRTRVQQVLKESGCELADFDFQNEGQVAWTVLNKSLKTPKSKRTKECEKSIQDTVKTFDRLHKSACDVEQAAEMITESLRMGGKLMLCGNGGSAAHAQHIAAEFTGQFLKKRLPLSAVSLTTDTSSITATGNDYGFEYIFSRKLEGIGKAGDILIALSTSGNSPNVLEALRTAKDMGIRTIGFTGADGGKMPPLCDLCIKVAADRVDHIQQMHIALGHIMSGLVEEALCT